MCHTKVNTKHVISLKLITDSGHVGFKPLLVGNGEMGANSNTKFFLDNTLPFSFPFSTQAKGMCFSSFLSPLNLYSSLDYDAQTPE